MSPPARVVPLSRDEGFRQRARYFLHAEKVPKDALRGRGHGDRALRCAAGGSPHAPLPLRTPIDGGRGTRTGGLAVATGAGGSSGPHSPFRPTGACLGWRPVVSAPAGCAWPGTCHRAGWWGGERSFPRSDDGWGCESETSAFDRYPGVLGAVRHRFGGMALGMLFPIRGARRPRRANRAMPSACLSVGAPPKTSLEKGGGTA